MSAQGVPLRLHKHILLDSLTRANLQMLIHFPIEAPQLPESAIFPNSRVRLEIQLAQISALPTLRFRVTLNGIQHTTS